MLNKFRKILSLFLVLIIGAQLAVAATLSISPSASDVNESRTFTSTVYVNAGGQSVNAVQGVINFPTDKLQVVSISKSSSIVDFWVKDPSFSNSSGSINFEGAIISGYSGSTGKVISITFRPKALGDASVSFSSAQVLANDGNGTNVLSANPGASYSIIKDTTSSTPTKKDVQPIKTDTEVPTSTQETSPEPIYSPQEVVYTGEMWSRVSSIFNWLFAILACIFVVLYGWPKTFSKYSKFRSKITDYDEGIISTLKPKERRDVVKELNNFNEDIAKYMADLEAVKKQRRELDNKEKELLRKIKEVMDSASDNIKLKIDKD